MNPLYKLLYRATGTELSGLGQKVVRGSSWQLAARIIQKLLFLASIAVVARVLDPSELGVAYTGLLVTHIVVALTQMGFDSQIIRKGRDAEKYLPTAFSTQIVRSAILGAIIFLTAPYSAVLLNSPESVNVIRFLGGVFIIGGLANPGLTLLQRDLEYKTLFKRSIAQTIADSGTTIAMTLMLQNYWGTILGSAAGQTATVIGSYLMVKVKPRPGFDWEKFKELFGYGKWLSLNTALSFFASTLDGIVVTRFAGPAGLALYQSANKFASLLTRELFLVANTSLFAGYAKMQGDMRRMRRAFQSSLFFSLRILSPVTVFMVFMAVPVVDILLTDRYRGAAPIFQVLAIAGLVGAPSRFVASMLNAMGMPRYTTFNSSIRLILFFALMIPFYRLYGIVGIALATLVPTLVTSLTLILFACKKLEMSPLKVGLKMLLILAGCILLGLPGLAVHESGANHAVSLAVGIALLFLSLVFTFRVPLYFSEDGSNPEQRDRGSHPNSPKNEEALESGMPNDRSA
jgi:O-antigen/teichoic acid export membrane protein